MLAASKRFSIRYCGILCTALLAGFVHMSLVWAGNNEDVASGSAAATIRGAGYPCAHVIKMERSKEEVAGDFSVWKVRCNSGSFKVTFEGGTGSDVVPLN